MTTRLPIYDAESEIIRSLKQNRRLILTAPTGSGKSTQVPQMLLEHGLLGGGQAVLLQPRRLAARLLAARVAFERQSPLGRQVGYQIRFENVSGAETRIKFVTEGVLLRQMLADPKLNGVQALIFDEFHERHLYGDVTLARAVELQEKSRPDLLLLVMSATLDIAALENYLRPCATLWSEGRTYPVEIEHAESPNGREPAAMWELAADAFARHARTGAEGDALVFMPGSYEIQQTLSAIGAQPEAKGRVLLPLHGELPPADQDAAVSRYERPKVVVATNVAETSLTIEGIRLVIDSGLARIPRYDPNRGINTLFVEKISRAAADQRAGRAGRTAPGRCVRLWSLADHSRRAAQERPEIKRLDLCETALMLKAAGQLDLRAFRWLEPPDDASLAHAEELLADLGALDSSGQITPLGRQMLAFPLHPRYSRMLLAARQHGCVYQAALIAALTQGRDLLLRNVDRQVQSFREDLFGEKAASDFWILMRAWNYAAKNNFKLDACRRAGIHAVTARQVRPLLDHFLAIARREGLPAEPGRVADDALQKCVLIGFSDRLARRLDHGTLRCELVHGRRGALARESVVQDAPLLVAAEVREVEGKDKTANTILSLATAVDPHWLDEIFPAEQKTELRVFFDSAAKRVMAEEQTVFRGLILAARRVEPPPPDRAAQLLAEEVFQARLALKNWDHSMDQWIVRLNCLSRWCPELQLPPLSGADRKYLLEQICQGAVSYRDIKEREVKNVVRSWIPPAQQELLEKHAPERIELNSGRSPKVTYAPDAPPFVAARIQELFGATAAPRIAMGRVPVLIHILAPNMRPVQITQDLASFWTEQYPKIKQELQRKYPKHEWR